MNDKERRDINRLTRILVSYARKRDIDRSIVEDVFDSAWAEHDRIDSDTLWKNHYNELIAKNKITIICPTDNEVLESIPDNSRRFGQIFICPIHNVPYTIINNETKEKISVDDRKFVEKIDKLDPQNATKFWKIIQSSIEV